MDDESLIELVREHSIVYDLTHPKYTDHTQKEKAWRAIGEAMKEDPGACKLRWYCIRRAYRKNLKRKVTYQDQSIRRYRYSDKLTFLDNTLNLRVKLKLDPSDDNYGSTEENSLTDQVGVKQELHEDYGGPYQGLCEVNNTTEEDLESESLTEKKRRIDGIQPHPVDSFLAGISPTLKSLSPYYLNLAKSKIFAVVQEFEMMMLMPAKGQNGGHDFSRFHGENSESI